MKTVVGVAIAVAVAVAAPYLGPLLAGAIGVSTSIATALVTVGLSVVAGVAMRALGLTPKPGKPSAIAGATPTVFRQSITDSFIVYGKRRVGGLLTFFHPRQSGADHYRYFVIACAGHRCQGETKWFLNDEEVAVNGAGLVTTGKYANAAWLWFQRGLASETANATFVSECGGKWTADHKGNGVAAFYAKFQMTDAVIQAGMPNITAEVEGKDDILDPRDASTGYTNNAALVFYDWMRLAREEGGFGAYDDEIPDDDWISAQANVCDETIALLGGGTEARYALDGVIVTGASPSEIRDAMVVNCAGSFTYSGGKFLMRPGYYVPVSETLSEDDLAGPITVSSFMSGDQTANEVHGVYVEPSNKYQSAAFAAQIVDPAPTDIRQLDLDLAFVTSKYRAERIARIMLNRAQAEKTVTWPMNIAGLKTQALDTVQIDTSRYGLSNYAFQVTSWGMSADFGVILTLREENADIYSEPADVGAPTVGAIDPAEPIVTGTPGSSQYTESVTFAPADVISDTYVEFGRVSFAGVPVGGRWQTAVALDLDSAVETGGSVPAHFQIVETDGVTDNVLHQDTVILTAGGNPPGALATASLALEDSVLSGAVDVLFQMRRVTGTNEISGINGVLNAEWVGSAS